MIQYLIDASAADTEKVITVTAEAAGELVKFTAGTDGILGSDTPAGCFTFGLAPHAQPCTLTMNIQPQQPTDAYDLNIHFDINETADTGIDPQEFNFTYHVQTAAQSEADAGEPRPIQFSFGGVIIDPNLGDETLTAAESEAFRIAQELCKETKFIYNGDEVIGNGEVTLDTMDLTCQMLVPADKRGILNGDYKVTAMLDTDTVYESIHNYPNDMDDTIEHMYGFEDHFWSKVTDWGKGGKKLTVTVSYKPQVEGNDRWFNAVYVFIVNDAK